MWQTCAVATPPEIDYETDDDDGNPEFITGRPDSNEMFDYALSVPDLAVLEETCSCRPRLFFQIRGTSQ